MGNDISTLFFKSLGIYQEMIRSDELIDECVSVNSFETVLG